MILVQRHFHVAKANRAPFERMSSKGLWPAMTEMGVQMVAYGTWGFAGTGDVVVTHTVYEDFDHWYATRRTAPGHRDGEKVGAFYDDPQIVGAISRLMPIYAERDVLIEHSEAYPFLLDEELSRPKVHYRTSDTGPSPLPPTFGRGSIVEEVSFEFDSDDLANDGKQQLSEFVWPTIEKKGGRVIGLGTSALTGDNSFTTFVSFPSFREYVEYGRMCPEDTEDSVRKGWESVHQSSKGMNRRLLIVGSDYGAKS